jgi:hypothetical protein
LVTLSLALRQVEQNIAVLSKHPYYPMPSFRIFEEANRKHKGFAGAVSGSFLFRKVTEQGSNVNKGRIVHSLTC